MQQNKKNIPQKNKKLHKAPYCQVDDYLMNCEICPKDDQFIYSSSNFSQLCDQTHHNFII